MMMPSSKLLMNRSKDYSVALAVKPAFVPELDPKLRGPKLNDVNEDQRALNGELEHVLAVRQRLVRIVNLLHVRPESRGYRGNAHPVPINHLPINHVPINRMSRQAL
jgi:hypothetical protein